MSGISEKGAGFASDLGDAVRQNPLSAALIGMGLVWFFTSGSSSKGARRAGLDRLPDMASDVVDAARSSLASGADAIGARVASAKEAVRGGGADMFETATRVGRDYADTASDYVRSVPQSGTTAFQTARDNLTEVFKAQPLALGAIGLAIGAGIAAALPSSDLEDTYLGKTSHAVRIKAVEFAAEQAVRAAMVAHEVAEEVEAQDAPGERAKAVKSS